MDKMEIKSGESSMCGMANVHVGMRHARPYVPISRTVANGAYE